MVLGYQQTHYINKYAGKEGSSKSFWPSIVQMAFHKSKITFRNGHRDVMRYFVTTTINKIRDFIYLPAICSHLKENRFSYYMPILSTEFCAKTLFVEQNPPRLYVVQLTSLT